jgi:hypothetical protein
VSTPLSQVFTLLGKLDDSAGEDTPRERFRRFIRESIQEVGALRDYIEECLRTSGDQYDRALQDFVIYIGHFLGFDVVFGRYRGVQGQIGFDGYWKSPTGFHAIIEVKTTEVYPIKASTLVGYVDQLISDKQIPDWDKALGLYVIGRPDPEIRQLENAIVAEKRAHQLRVVSAESLLSLAETMNEHDVSHEDILALVRPSGPRIDPVLELLSRLMAEPRAGESAVEEPDELAPASEGKPVYWITPVKSDDEETADECIKKLVGEEGIYAFGERTPGRQRLKTGDWICFYASGGIGIVAHAKVASSPEYQPNAKVHDPEKYPWVFRVVEPSLYLNHPFVIDAAARARLDKFRGRDANSSWGWFVQATRDISEHDFRMLTRSEAKSASM